MSLQEKISFLRSSIIGGSFDRGNQNYGIWCPACADSNSSKKKLFIHVETGMYHCWVCGIKGQKINSLYRRYFPSHTDRCDEVYGKTIFKYDDNEEDKDLEEVVNIPKGFILLAQNNNKGDPDVVAATNYCLNRGLSVRDMWYFKIGTCTTGRFRRRIIIPSFNAEGILNYYVGRSIDGGNKIKYLNAKVAKRNIIFNEINLDWKSELTIVEGPMDLMKCNENATCLLGSSMPEDSLLFSKIISNRTPVLLALDSDMQDKAHQYAENLSSYDVQVRMLNLGEYSDVGEMTKNHFMNQRKNAKTWCTMHGVLQSIGSIKSGSLI